MEQVYVHTFKIRICVYLQKFQQAVKLLKKVMKMMDWNDVSISTISYLIGNVLIDIDDAKKESTSWLKNIIQNEKLWFLKISHKHTPQIMELKLRSLFKLGLIEFDRNEFKTARLMLIEFCITVEVLRTKLDNSFDFPFNGLFHLVHNIDEEVISARNVLAEISLMKDKESSANPSEELCNLIKRFQAERKFYQFTEMGDSISTEKKIQAIEYCINLQKGTCYEDTHPMRQLQLNLVDHLAESNRVYEAIQKFEELQELFLTDHMTAIHNLLLKDEESQSTARMYFYNTFDTVDTCYKKLHMDEERKDFAEICCKVINKYPLITSMRLEIDVITNIYQASDAIKDFKTCLQNLNLAKTYIQKNKKMFIKIGDTNGKRHHPELKMADITIMKGHVEFMKIKFQKGSKETYKKFLSKLPLKYDCKDSQQLDLYENYINRIICFYELGQYEDAKVTLERAHEIIPTSFPKYQESFYLVAKILLDLKSGVIQNPGLADEWKFPLHYEGTLNAFKIFNSPPKYSYEYLNKQSNHSKTSDSTAEKSTLRKWRMFKNSALIIGKARHMVEMDRMKF